MLVILGILKLKGENQVGGCFFKTEKSIKRIFASIGARLPYKKQIYKSDKLPEKMISDFVKKPIFAPKTTTISLWKNAIER